MPQVSDIQLFRIFKTIHFPLQSLEKKLHYMRSFALIENNIQLTFNFKVIQRLYTLINCLTMQNSEETSRNRYEQKIDKFDQFKKYGMLLNKQQFEQHRLKLNQSTDKPALVAQFERFAEEILTNLEQSKEKKYILFFDWLPEDFRNVFISLTRNQYPSWSWDFEPLFFGSKKQLIIYKNYRPIVQYLERYRMPNTFEPKKLATHNLILDIDNAKMDRNQMVSEDKDIEEISKTIQSLENKLEVTKKDFYALLATVLEDFKAQQKRKEFIMRSLKMELMKDIKAIIEKTGLFYQIREASRIYWEAFIKKQRFQEPRDYEQQLFQYTSSVNRETNEPRELRQPRQLREPRQLRNPKVTQKKDLTKVESDDDEEPSQPNKVKHYDIVKIEFGTVDVRFRIPFNNLSPITKFNAYTVDQEGLLTFNAQLLYSPKQGDLYEKMTLKGQGLCLFTIKAENEIGLALEYDTFSCYIPQQKNKKIIMVGATLDGIMGSQECFSEYQIAQLPSAIPASRISIREAALVVDTSGTLAMWGNIYQREYEEEDGVLIYENQDDKQDLPVCEISPPYQIDELKFVTKISCGQFYYLVCDAVGRAWSFGSNWKHCLGLGNVGKTTNTFDPVEIPYFKKNKIFIVDVVASNEHALALDNKGYAYSWGVYEGEMKNYPIKDSFGSVVNYTIGQQRFYNNEPRRISNQKLNIKKVTKIRAGINFSGVLTQQGQLLTWGSNIFGQLGSGKLIVDHTQIRHILVPVENSTFKKLQLKVIDFEAGSFHCLAVAEDKHNKKSLYSWGMSAANQCGHDLAEVVWEPKLIDYFKDHEIQIISAGDSGSVVKTNKGIFVFGRKTFLAKELDKQQTAAIRLLDFTWWPKVQDIKLAENTAAFLVDY